MGAIYSILNTVNGKIYIGQSINPFKRFYHHKSDLRNNIHYNKHLQRSWNKYGEDSFQFNILEECSDENLNDNEKWWIDYFASTKPSKGYNFRTGGGAGGKHSEETKLKISNSRRGKTVGENNPFYGKTHSKQTKIKIGKTLSSMSTTTGYYRVIKKLTPSTKQGYSWQYQYYENGKRKSLMSVSIDKLKEKVLSEGLEWMEIDKGV